MQFRDHVHITRHVWLFSSFVVLLEYLPAGNQSEWLILLLNQQRLRHQSLLRTKADANAVV